jgi:hypothetical protein
MVLKSKSPVGWITSGYSLYVEFKENLSCNNKENDNYFFDINSHNSHNSLLLP